MPNLFYETTQVGVNKSIADTQNLLAQAGATAIMTEYDAGEPEGLAFRLQVNGQYISFQLPCRWRSLIGKVKVTRYQDEEEVARRVAWRQIYWWVKAQLALRQTEMVDLMEIFLPYAQHRTGETVYQRLKESKFLAITDARQEGR